MHVPPEAVPTVIEDISFPGPSGMLQGELVYPESADLLGSAVLAGPHPLLGGNMLNNVICKLGDGLAGHGLASLRFNYRGVGRSDGPVRDLKQHLAQFWQTSHIPNEMTYADDVVAAAEHLQAVTGSTTPPILIGYSFGCSLLPQVLAKTSATALVLIAPTISKHDYSSYHHLPCLPPLLVIAADDDFASDTVLLQEWFARLPGEHRLEHCQLDNHFFRGHENWLLERVLHFFLTIGSKPSCPSN